MRRGFILRPKPVGLTIDRLMMLSVVALVLWVGRPGALGARFEKFVLLGLGAVLVGRILILIHEARLCAVCGRREVGRVTAVPFGAHYFRCAACGQRMKRLGLGRLWDASGLDDERHYRKHRPATIWDDAPILPTPEALPTRTVGTLLREKIDRDATASPAVARPDLIEDFPVPAPPEIEPFLPVGERALKTLEKLRWSRRSPR